MSYYLRINYLFKYKLMILQNVNVNSCKIQNRCIKSIENSKKSAKASKSQTNLNFIY